MACDEVFSLGNDFLLLKPSLPIFQAVEAQFFGGNGLWTKSVIKNFLQAGLVVWNWIPLKVWLLASRGLGKS